LVIRYVMVVMVFSLAFFMHYYAAFILHAGMVFLYFLECDFECEMVFEGLIKELFQRLMAATHQKRKDQAAISQSATALASSINHDPNVISVKDATAIV
jgi:hypothetical protein